MEYKYKGTGDFKGLIIESALPKKDWKFGVELLVYCDSEEEDNEDDPFKCAVCKNMFDPSDWQNDVCDKCLYKK